MVYGSHIQDGKTIVTTSPTKGRGNGCLDQCFETIGHTITFHHSRIQTKRKVSKTHVNL